MGLDRQQDEFVSRYYKEMYQQLMVYARSSLSNPSLAEEAVQDTFRIACAKIDDFMSSPNRDYPKICVNLLRGVE